MSATHPLRDYFVLEARHAARRPAIAMTIGAGLVVPGTHALLERFPAGAIAFLEQAFRIEGLAAVLLINDLLAVYFATYFVGLMGLLAVTVTAREEDRLEILLAKPIRARVLLAARAWPVLLLAAASGIVVSLVIAFTLRPYLEPGDAISAGGALGSGLFFVGFAILSLSALLPLLVRMRDGFHALLVASLAWIAPVFPTAFFIYRPDFFEAHDRLASIVVLSTLLWHDATSAWLGPVTVAIALPFGALMIAVAGVVLERTDAR